MNQLCLSTNLNSSDIAAWAQAIVSSIALIVGACVVIWQTRRARLELCEREARAHDGLARLLIHLRESAQEARMERRKLERWPPGHPAEPSTRFNELANALHQFSLDSIHGEVPLNALLTARRARQRACTDSQPGSGARRKSKFRECLSSVRGHTRSTDTCSSSRSQTAS